MKRIFLLAMAVLGMATATMANEGVNPHFEKGYTADIQLVATTTNAFRITSSHGYGFGNGLYVGGGVGFGAEWESGNVSVAPHYVPSLFINARWSMSCVKVSPFVDVKAMQYIDLSEGKATYGVVPSVGVDMGRFSLGVGYAFRGTKSGVEVGVGFTF